MNTVIASKTPTEFELILTDEYRAAQQARAKEFLADYTKDFEDISHPRLVQETGYVSLDTLLVAVWEARQQGLSVTTCDEPRQRRIGFMLGDDNWAYIGIVNLKNSLLLTAETLALYGLTQAEFRSECHKPNFWHWLATGVKIPMRMTCEDGIEIETFDPDEGQGEVSEEDAKALINIWIAESEKDKPVDIGEFFPETLIKTVEVEE